MLSQSTTTELASLRGYWAKLPSRTNFVAIPKEETIFWTPAIIGDFWGLKNESTFPHIMVVKVSHHNVQHTIIEN